MSDFKKNYRVSGSAPFDYRTFDLVRLEISIGQDYSEGPKFKACVEWATKNFSNVVLLLGDTLQRHNIRREHRLSSEEAFAYTKQQGKDWFIRNRSNIPANCQIVYWKEFLSDENYFSTLTQVRDLYHSNGAFRNALNQVILEAAGRKLKRGEDFVWREFKQSSLSYLLEETAGLALAYERFPGVSAYHGSYNDMWGMFIEKNIPGAPVGLNNSHCVRLQTRPKHTKKQKLAA